MEGCLERGHNPALGARLAATLYRFWVLHGHLTEGVRWLSLAYAAGGRPEAARTPEAARVRGRLCSLGGYVIMCLGDYQRSLAWAEEGLALNRAFGSPADIAQASIQIAWSTWMLDDIVRAQSLFEEALRLSVAAGHRWYAAVCHFHMGGIALDGGRYALAEEHWLASLGILRELGEELGVADTLGTLGALALLRGQYDEASEMFRAQVAQYRALGVVANLAGAIAANAELAVAEGDYAAARRHCEEALVAFKQQANDFGVAYILYTQAQIDRCEGAYDQAEALLHQSLALIKETQPDYEFHLAGRQRALGLVALARGDRPEAQRLLLASLALFLKMTWYPKGIAEGLRCLGLLWSEVDCAARGACLLAASAASRDAAGYVLSPADAAETGLAVAAMRAALGAADFAAAWARGAAMTLEQGAALALAPM